MTSHEARMILSRTTDVFTDCTTITPRLYGSVLVTEDNAGEIATAMKASAWVDRDRRTGVVTGVTFDSASRFRRAKVGEYIVAMREHGLTLYQSYTADEYADTYAPYDDGDPAALRAELEAVRELSEERRAALHYVIHPDEGRTEHPTTGRLRELAEPDAEYRYCGATLDQPNLTYTCQRRVTHRGECGPQHDR